MGIRRKLKRKKLKNIYKITMKLKQQEPTFSTQECIELAVNSLKPKPKIETI